jgi:hypothetical protein
LSISRRSVAPSWIWLVLATRMYQGGRLELERVERREVGAVRCGVLGRLGGSGRVAGFGWFTLPGSRGRVWRRC